jgi:hypothetical protein
MTKIISFHNGKIFSNSPANSSDENCFQKTSSKITKFLVFFKSIFSKIFSDSKIFCFSNSHFVSSLKILTSVVQNFFKYFKKFCSDSTKNFSLVFPIKKNFIFILIKILNFELKYFEYKKAHLIFQ